MPFVPNPNAARIIIGGQLSGFPCLNVWHVQMANPDNSADLQAAGSVISNAWADNFIPILSQDYSFDSFTCYSLVSDTSPVVTVTAPSPLAGAVTSDSESRNVAIVLTLRTGTRGRTGRGRKYVGGVPEGDTSDGSLSPADLTAWQSAANAFLLQVNTGSIALCVYSQFVGGLPRTLGVLRPVTAIEIRSPVPGSQRRRSHREDTA